jgi:hypothetical protein
MEDTLAAQLTAAYRATEAALPAGWQLDGLRCASTGLGPEERSDKWRALARGPAGATVEGRGDDPLLALADLAKELRASL